MKKLSNLMLFANFVSTLFYSMSYPYIYQELIKAVSRKYVSFEQIISCIGIVVFGTVWNKYGDIIFKHYVKILVLEIVADTILFADILIRGDLKFYFVLNVIIYAVITKNLCCGGIKLRAKVNPTEKLREQFDNNSNSIYAISTLLGTVITLIFNINLKTLFVLALVGNISDNFAYFYIYKKVIKLNL